MFRHKDHHQMHHFFHARMGGFAHRRGGGPGGRGPGGRGRGSVKYDILAVLHDGPRHGYDIMLAIEERRGGFRPSPGSIYPALQMLEDEEAVRGQEVDGKRIYTITEKGGKMLADHAESGGFDKTEGEESFMGAASQGAQAMHALMSAAKHIFRSGDAEALGRAAEIIDRARRELYAILAEEG